MEETTANKSERLGIYIVRQGVEILTVSDGGQSRKSIAVELKDLSQAKIAEEAVYTDPKLLADYAMTAVVADSNRFMVVPLAVADDPDALSGICSILWPDVTAGDLTVNNAGADCAVVSVLDASLTGFVHRTFSNPSVIHRMAALIYFFSRLSRPVNKVKIYAHFADDNRLDILAFSHDGLLMANTFECQEMLDAVYFIMAAVKDTGFDALDDELLLSGDSRRMEQTIATLRKYVNSVMPLLMPKEITDSPLELQIVRGA